jgi:hypothetical protein
MFLLIHVAVIREYTQGSCVVKKMFKILVYITVQRKGKMYLLA